MNGGNFLDVEAISRRTMVLIFIVDTSGSMDGEKIGAVNEAIREVIPEIKNINNADAKIKIAVLDFSSGAKWIYNKPIEAENFSWSNLDAAGMTDMGKAFKLLNEKLSRTGFMNEAEGSYAPCLFLMSDGEPTDDYKSGLNDLKQNKWFKAAIKVAVAIGSDANTEVLKEFTGNSECVLTVRTPEALKKMIVFASMTVSQIGSKSRISSGSDSDENPEKQAAVAQQMQEYTQSQTDNDEGW
ncbi:MAG TPA: VWA domain-containing protein [Bacteroidales bacterium]|nr:VWA domain-containing protein [Bacteroidales bacterium]